MTPALPGAAALRVAVLSPIAWRTPPRHYGPWEQFASTLAEGLVRRGVEVTLFATADSITKGHLVGSAPCGYAEDPELDAKVWECLHISSVFERASEFDLIHNGFDFLPLTYSGLVETPMVTTIHGFSSEKILPVFQRYESRGHYVAISDSDRHPTLDYAATIHHGIDMRAFEVGVGPREHLLFFGRIHPHKGTREAIEVAHRTGLPLVIAGIIQDRAYFEREVEPHLGDRIRYVGSVGPVERGRLLGGARALLHLVSFDEPFGYSVVEAMACGTPVVATRRGSMPEIVREGAGGRLVSSVDEAVVAVADVAELSPLSVRESVAKRFDHERMIDDYLALYGRILGSSAKRTRP